MKSLRLSLILPSVFLLASCLPNQATFPQEKLKESIRDICQKDYGISNVDVKIVGRTVGVHLPLNQLFENDIEQLMASGKIKDVESLLELSPEAIDKIQDVIFTTSRVIFSSNANIDFYVLKATDYDKTGIEFIIANYIEDVKRVRLWDIELSEYYKRSYRDLRMNKSIFLKKTVLDLFKNLGTMPVPEIFQRYFVSTSTLKDISPFFYAILLEYEFKKNVNIKVLASKARVFKGNEILVYLKAEETYEPRPEAKEHKFLYPSGTRLEYMFILSPSKPGIRISRVLPFNYIAPGGGVKKIDFPESLKLYENIETWPSDFEVDEVFLDEFLADQMNRRLQYLAATDEKVQKAFDDVKGKFLYFPERKRDPLADPALETAEGKAKFFSLSLELKPKNTAILVSSPRFIEDADVQYVIKKILEEFYNTLRSYGFQDYDFLRFQIAGSDQVYQLGPDALKKFAKGRPKVAELLNRYALSGLT